MEALTAASHQPITNPATGRTTVYVEISRVGCIEGVATCQRLAPPCTRPGSVKSQGLLPVALGPPESLPALPLGEVRDPDGIGTGLGEAPLHQVGRASSAGIGDRGAMPAAATGALQAEVAHQPLDGAAGHRTALTIQRQPDLAGAVDAVVDL